MASCFLDSSSRFSQPELFGTQILLVGPGDYALNGATSRCMQMVQKAAANRQSRLMFTPTLFWVDKNFQQRKSVNSQVLVSACDLLF